MQRFLWLIVLLHSFLFAGCESTPLTPEERLGRQVMFTVVGQNITVPVVNGYTVDNFPGLTSREESLQPRVGKIISLHRLRKVSQWSIKALGLEAIVAEIKGDRSVEQVIDALARDERVESAQPLLTYDVLSYNDPYFELQKASVTGADIESIHKRATGKDVVVAVVDTGADRNHPEYSDKVIQSRNFVDHDSRQFDIDEHGTEVAGLIASTANNDLGIVGVAPGVKLMLLKACWQNNMTRRAQCDSYSIMKALVEVLKLQPDIVNLSLAGPPDPLINRLVEAAHDRGIILVGAVDPNREQSFPASMNEVIAVGASLNPNQMPENGLLAPGTDILTTTPGSTYAFRSGSSMSTAYVSGIAALLKEQEPMLSAEQLRAQLAASSRYSVNRVPVVDICRAVIGIEDDNACPADLTVAERR